MLRDSIKSQTSEPSKIYVTQPKMMPSREAERVKAINQGYLVNTSPDYSYVTAAAPVPVATAVKPAEHLSSFDRILLGIPGLRQFVDEHRQVSHATKAADDSLVQLAEKENLLNQRRALLLKDYKLSSCRAEDLRKAIERMISLRLSRSEEYSQAQYNVSLLELKLAIEQEKKTFSAIEQVGKELQEVDRVRTLIKNCASDSNMVADVMYNFNNRMRGLRLGAIQQRKVRAAENVIEEAEDIQDDNGGVSQMLQSYDERRFVETENSLEAELKNLEIGLLKNATENQSWNTVNTLPEVFQGRPKKNDNDKPPESPPDLGETDANRLIQEEDLL